MFKKIVIFIGSVLLVGVLVLNVFTNNNPVVLINNESLNNELKKPKHERIHINHYVPFHWDHGYYFSPYIEKSEIIERLHVDSFPDNLYKEGQAHLIFVYHGHIEAIIQGMGRSRGYWFSFSATDFFSFTPADDVIFHVEKQSNNIYKYELAI